MHFICCSQFQEAEVTVSPQYIQPLSEFYRVWEPVQNKELDSVLKWATENREALLQVGSNLEFKLHQKVFIDILKKCPSDAIPVDALNYARAHFTPFAQTNAKGSTYLTYLMSG